MNIQEFRIMHAAYEFCVDAGWQVFTKTGNRADFRSYLDKLEHFVCVHWLKNEISDGQYYSLLYVVNDPKVMISYWQYPEKYRKAVVQPDYDADFEDELQALMDSDEDFELFL